uniref:response regulator n=1 Tax=Fulvivirga sp. TaxID=1931237 RepID=UPI00404A5D13
MIKALCTFFVFLLLHINSIQAQNEETLIDKAISFIETDSSQSMQLFSESLKAAKNELEKLELYDDYCVELVYLSKLDLLYALSTKALQTPITNQNSRVYLRLLKMKFDVFNLKKEYDSIHSVLNNLYRLSTQYQDTSSMITALVEQGAMSETIGNLSKGLDQYLMALELAEQNGDPNDIAMCQVALAIFYEKTDRERESIEFNLKALATYSQLGTTIKMAQIYNNIGLAYDGLEMHDSAGYYFDKGYAIADELGSEFGKAVTKLNIGLNRYRKKQYDQAIVLFNDVFQFFNNVSDDYGMCLCYYNLCRIKNDQNEITSGIEYGLKGHAIAKEKGFINEWREISRELSELYEKRKDSGKALNFYKEYVIANDSLSNKEKEQEIGRLESRFELNKSLYENQLKEKENLILTEAAQIQKQKIQFQTTIIILVLALLIILSVFAFLLRRQLIHRKKLIKKIEAQADKLQQLDMAKTRFFANISHDLRTPLTLILGALDKISGRDSEPLDRSSHELLDMGIKNGKRLLYLADEIMDLTRLEEGKVKLESQHVKIVPYLRLLTKMFSSAADIKSIELSFTTTCEEETILQLDPHQFEKIIYNLLSNAIKFTPEKGSVNVELENVQDQLIITIQDSGPGISADSLESIFDRFYQSETIGMPQAGVGIGLALVKELVELHDGSITVESQKVGSKFLIHFPFKKSDWISNPIIPERSLEIVTRNSLWMDLQEEKDRLQVPALNTSNENAKNILIVEDHKELRSYLKSMLSPIYRIYIASNGNNALELLETEKIDLIITDLMMPYMDGFELIDHLKNDKSLKKIPVIVVSARTDTNEKIGLISKGAEDVIHKPFDKDELLIKIKKILEREWDGEKQLGKLFDQTAQAYEKNIMQKLERLIIKRISDPHLSVLDLADEMAASERKVYRLIKKISGLTPYELIKEIRWQYLDNYMKDYPIKNATEACQLIGMSNVSSFASQYEKRFGHSFKEVISAD